MIINNTKYIDFRITTEHVVVYQHIEHRTNMAFHNFSEKTTLRYVAMGC